jgi:hypothetical protein
MILPDPQVLDVQMTIHIDMWVDLDSEEHRRLDDNLPLTKKWLKLLMSHPPLLHLDKLGRLFLVGNDGKFDPFHFESGGKMIGLRISKQAVN